MKTQDPACAAESLQGFIFFESQGADLFCIDHIAQTQSEAVNILVKSSNS